MILELTNEYQIILPVMLTTTIATVFARVLGKESIYTTALVRKGLDVEGGRDINVLRSLPVKTAMRTSLERVSQNTTLSDLMDLMSASQHSVFFITDRPENVIGYVTLNDLRKLIRDADVLSHLVIAGDIAHPVQFSLHEDDSLDRAMGLFAQEGIDELSVITSGDSAGPSATLWRQDVIEIYNREIFRRDMASELAEKIVSHDLTPQPVQIVSGFSILEREVPRFLVGKTIRGSHIRDQYGIEIILVKSKNEITGATEESMPSAGYRLQSQDSILIFGETVKIRHFASL
jgi:CIC family chloride channel protein